MKKYLIGSSMRLFLVIAGSIILLGIWLTGFDKVHWLLYIMPVFFYFAAITGICPGMIVSKFIMGDKPKV